MKGTKFILCSHRISFRKKRETSPSKPWNKFTDRLKLFSPNTWKIQKPWTRDDCSAAVLDLNQNQTIKVTRIYQESSLYLVFLSFKVQQQFIQHSQRPLSGVSDWQASFKIWSKFTFTFKFKLSFNSFWKLGFGYYLDYCDVKFMLVLAFRFNMKFSLTEYYI